MWLRLRPHNLPRSVSGIVMCAVYIQLKSPFQDVLINHLLMTLDSLKSKHPDTGVVILVDFNRTNISLLCRAHSMKQFVDKATRGNAILDLIVTNLIKNTVRPLRKHNMFEFDRWITSHSWSKVLDGPNTTDKAVAFYATVQEAIDIHVPTQSCQAI